MQTAFFRLAQRRCPPSQSCTSRLRPQTASWERGCAGWPVGLSLRGHCYWGLRQTEVCLLKGFARRCARHYTPVEFCPYAMVTGGFCAAYAPTSQVNFPRLLISDPQIVQEAARAKGRKQTTPVWAQFRDIRVGNVSIISHRFSLLPIAGRLECPKITNPRFFAVHSLTHIAQNLQSRIHESPTRARVKELQLVTSRTIWE